MTRDDWQHVEPLLAEALQLPSAEQERALRTSDLNDVIRRELLDVLRRTNVIVPRLGGVAAGRGPVTPLVSDEPDRVPPLASNDTIADGRFRIIRQLGRGGMGDVYLASDTRLEALVALKVLPRVSNREAQFARRCCGHPHIVTVHDVIEASIGDRAITVLVMEHITGRPATQAIDDGIVPIHTAVRWAREAADALAHAHDAGVIHCDLKPANLLITEAGVKVKVVDFGIGRTTCEAPRPGAHLAGTLPYMAPEQLSERRCSPASDIYALGVTLFELLTSRLPFEGRDSELILRIIGAPPPRVRDLRPEIPHKIDEIVSQAMAKDPSQRFRSARAFASALAALDDDYKRHTHYPFAIAGAAIGAVAFAGFVTSTFYASPLQLTREFSGESVGTTLLWGVKAIVAASIFTVMAAAAITIVKGAVAFLARRTPLEQRWAAIRRGRSDVARATSGLAAQIAFLVALYWYFNDFFKGLDSFISQGSPSALFALSPANGGHQITFDFLLCAHAWVFGVAWWRRVREPSAAAGPVRRIATTGLIVTIAAVFVGEIVPFRIVWHNRGERVTYQSQRCYVKGERGSQVLLFCPGETPRSRVVPLNDPALHREGIVENVFTAIPPPRHDGGTE